MKTSVRIDIAPDTMEHLRDFVARKWQQKIKEYPQDARQIVDRNIIGATGEYAVLKHYGKVEYLDTSIGNSWDYQDPDLWKSPKNKPTLPDPKIPADIKTCKIGNVPLVKRGHITVNLDGVRCQCPNIICVSDFKSVWILGIASPTILKTCVDDSLIKSARNPAKTAFYGADQLETLPETWDGLRDACDKLKENV